MNFGFLLFEDLEELDLVGPWEMISMWSKDFGGPKNCLMIAEKNEPVKCYNGMIVTPHISFSNTPKLDYLLIPGGIGTRKEVKNNSRISNSQLRDLYLSALGSFLFFGLFSIS